MLFLRFGWINHLGLPAIKFVLASELPFFIEPRVCIQLRVNRNVVTAKP